MKVDCYFASFLQTFVIKILLVLEDNVTKKYHNAKSNLQYLKKQGACLLHKVDATSMRLHPVLRKKQFDRIIFNFPHAGCHGREDNSVMIK